MRTGRASKVEVGFRVGNLEVVSYTKDAGIVTVACKCHTCGSVGYTINFNELKRRGKKLSAKYPDEVLSCTCQSHRLRGISKTKEDPLNKKRSYHVWRMMMVRCYRDGYPAYKNYGARGITVCERWHNYENFFADMGEPPLKHDLERKDNSKGYCVDNCGWRTRRRNCNNKRTNVHVEINGVTYTVSQAAKRFGVKRSTFAYRLANCESPESAVKRPSSSIPTVYSYGGLELTASEWAEHWGVHEATAYKRLKRLLNTQEYSNGTA